MFDESDKLPPADYSHVFPGDDKTSAEKLAKRRRKNSSNDSFFGGLMCCLIPTIFICVGVGITANDIRKHYTFAHVTGTVMTVDGANGRSDRIAIVVAFEHEGKQHSHTESALEDEAGYDRLAALRVGQDFPLRFGPANPAAAAYDKGPSTAPLSFALFALFFLPLGLQMFWRKISGKNIWRAKSFSGGTPLPGGGYFMIFIGLCLLSVALNFAADALLDWPMNLVGSLFCIFGIVIGGMMISLAVGRGIAQRKAAARAALADAPAEQREQAQAEPHAGSLGRKMAIGIGITVFVWGILSVFLSLVAGMTIKHHIAHARFLTTEGEILASRVVEKTDSEGDRKYEAFVKYEYVVNGQTYVSRRHDYMVGGLSESGRSSRIVAEHPVGKRVKVYYDPKDPAEAILSLEVPGVAYVLMLFLQPFIMMGLVLIVAVALMPFHHNRLKRFLTEPFGLPWRVPKWGTMRAGYHGMTLRPAFSLTKPLIALVIGYGVTCFISVFGLIFILGGFGEPKTSHVATAIQAAVGVGVVCFVVMLFRQGRRAVLTINPDERTISLKSPKREVWLPFDDIESWRIRALFYKGGMAINGRRRKCMLLEVLTKDGQRIPIHTFKLRAGAEDEDKALMRRVQQVFAEITGSQARKSIVEPDSQDAEPPRNPAEAIGATVKFLRDIAKDDYGDLA